MATLAANPTAQPHGGLTQPKAVLCKGVKHPACEASATGGWGGSLMPLFSCRLESMPWRLWHGRGVRQLAILGSYCITLSIFLCDVIGVIGVIDASKSLICFEKPMSLRVIDVSLRGLLSRCGKPEKVRTAHQRRASLERMACAVDPLGRVGTERQAWSYPCVRVAKGG